ncbi:MAG: hypothetical protein HQK84_01370 [Nitrospinae bacterium]|nr:hypothetical protein [Nitrospinota bacterium]
MKKILATLIFLSLMIISCSDSEDNRSAGKYKHISEVPEEVKAKMSREELEKIPGFNWHNHISGY